MSPLIGILFLFAVVAVCYGIYRLVRRLVRGTPSSKAPMKPENTPANPDAIGENQMVVGTVGGFQVRNEPYGQASKTVWTFRIERFDAEGNRLPPVPVEMKATKLSGFVTDGDRVSVNISGWKPGKLLSPKSFYNETTQSEVKVEGCFIATAAFGDANDNYVQSLRSYRDASLYRSAIGRSFVSFYYIVSPAFASLIARSELAKRTTRVFLKLVIGMLIEPQSPTPKGASHD
jgi:hypothetical protein